ncbi:hypothetical protein ACHAP3_002037 [Botrytis cinerea]
MSRQWSSAPSSRSHSLQRGGSSFDRPPANDLTAPRNVSLDGRASFFRPFEQSTDPTHRRPVMTKESSKSGYQSEGEESRSGDNTRRRTGSEARGKRKNSGHYTDGSMGSGKGTDRTTRGRKLHSGNPKLENSSDRNPSLVSRTSSTSSTGSTTLNKMMPGGDFDKNDYYPNDFQQMSIALSAQKGKNSDQRRRDRSESRPRKDTRDGSVASHRAPSTKSFSSGGSYITADDGLGVKTNKTMAKRPSFQEIDQSQISLGKSALLLEPDGSVAKPKSEQKPVRVPPQGKNSETHVNHPLNNGNEINQVPRTRTLGAETLPQPPLRPNQDYGKWGSFGGPERHTASNQSQSFNPHREREYPQQPKHARRNASPASSNTHTGFSKPPEKYIPKHFNEIVGPPEKERTKKTKKKKKKRGEGEEEEGGERRYSRFRNVFSMWGRKNRSDKDR